MAYVVARNKRYTGYYKDSLGKTRSAGTFGSRAKALNSALLAEEGIVSDNPELRTTLEAYLKDWLSRTDVRISTRKTYAVSLKKYVVPSLGHRQVTTITKRDVRSLFEKLLKEGVSPSTIAHVKIALGSAFRPLVDDDQMPSNPTHGVKVKVPHADPFTNLEPDDFKKILKHLPTEGARLFAEFLIASGCRFGEATELRVKDINFKSKEVSVRRTVSDVGSQHNNGSRYLVVPTTKNNHKRTIVLSSKLLNSLQKFISTHKLTTNELIFSRETVTHSVKLLVSGSLTERTESNYTVGSKVFRHATPYSYNVGGCRCDLCKQAVNKYRKQYRKDKSKGRGVSRSNFSGHLSRERWRATWNDAIEKSGIGWYPRTHDLRHANATLLLKRGVDVHEVKERLGHQSITTTERYLHRIRHQQSKAGELADEYLLGKGEKL
jgi:site-specific recombinase XerD